MQASDKRAGWRWDVVRVGVPHRTPRVLTQTFIAAMAIVCGGCPHDSPTAPENVVTIVVSASSVEFASVGSSSQPISASPKGSKGQSISTDVSWRSSNDAVATVTKTGSTTAQITPHRVGTAVITAFVNSTEQTVNVTVNGTGTMTSVTPSPVNLPIGQTQVLTAQISVDLGADGSLTWNSSDPSRVTVQPTGATTAVITAVAVGTATITVRLSAFPSEQRTVIVTVQDIVSVSVAPSPVNTLVGDQTTLVPTTNPPNIALQWSSSNVSVATVNNTGVVSSISCGTNVKIRATAAGKPSVFGEATFNVSGRITSLALNPTGVTLHPGDTFPIPLPTFGGDTCADKTVSYTSNNVAVATVSATGVVTAVDAGTTTITVRSTADPTKSVPFNVTVNGTVQSVVVNPPSATLGPNGTVALSATVTADAGVSQAVTWSSSDPTVASVSQSGLVTASASLTGVVTITARSVVPTKSGSAQITVGSVNLVTVDQQNAKAIVSGTLAFTATVTRDPGLAGTVTWSSSSTNIATVVAATGVATCVAQGSATIRATSTVDVSKSGTSTLTCGRVTSVSLAPPTATLNTTTTTSYTPLPTVVADAGFTAVVWTSSNTQVVTVNQAGLVTAVARGSATINACSQFDASKCGTSVVTVQGVVMVLSPKRDSMRVTWQRQITASVTADGALSNAVTWLSRNPSVVSVNATGLTTGVAIGQTYVVATPTGEPGKKDSALVMVLSACQLPWPHFIGQTFNGVINGTSCNGTTETIAFSGAGGVAYSITATAPFSYGFYPLITSGGYWYYPFINFSPFTAYVVAGPGSYLAQMVANPAGASGNISMTTALWNQTGCRDFIVTTQTQTSFIPVDAACTTGYQPFNTVGSFYSFTTYLVPFIASGQTVTITLTGGGGLDPRVDLYNANTGVRLGSAVSNPGAASVQLAFTASGSTAGFYYLRVSTRLSLMTGSVRVLILGPSATAVAPASAAAMNGAPLRAPIPRQP